jgi:hypothetical protein
MILKNSFRLEDTAYANRGEYYHFESMTRWVNPELDQICREYARNLSKTIKERGGVKDERGVGAYANTVEQQIDAKGDLWSQYRKTQIAQEAIRSR